MQILELSTAVPEKKNSTLQLLESFPCQIPERTKQNILNLGVENRNLVDYYTTNHGLETVLKEIDLVDLCVKACQHAIKKAGLTTDDFSYFIAAYDQNPFLCPGLSQLLIRELGFDSYIKHVNIQGMACTAFTKTLELAKAHLTVHPNDFVLLCLSGVNSYWFQNQVNGLKAVMEIDKINSLKNEVRRVTELRKWIATMEYFLFGDGVASLIVGKEGEGLTIKKIAEVTNLKPNDYLAGYTRLTNFNEPFKFGLYSHLDKRIPELGVEYLSHILSCMFGENRAESLKTMKELAVHTGSQKILNTIADRFGVEQEKLSKSFEVLRKYGNLAGASLPFILREILSENRLREGDRVLSLGYGWGFSASSCLLEFRE
jgi:predicted naringenin-chalcone synthase